MSAKEKRKTKPHTTAKATEKTRKRATTATRTKRTEKKPAITAQPKPTQTIQQQTQPSAPPKETPFFLVIRIRGSFGIPPDVEHTLRNLRLINKFNAILLEKNPSMLGMLRHGKDYVTWGEVNSADIANLLRKRGEVDTGNRLTDQYVKEFLAQQSIDSLANALANGEIKLKTLWQKGVKAVFRLHPPSGGFSGTIKRPFNSRGELGYRHAEISGLMSKMT
ncbi:MAG TPA: 50S ribosomal protein L30 [Candidatus Bathyarchaeia archaeon]|nr:50S ribosomal protein L30 [Candidatus Bathyarchaeia archaeon]